MSCAVWTPASSLCLWGVTNSELLGNRGTHNDAQLVEPDARTDSETVCTTVWNVLKRSPKIILKRSKVVVGIFLK